MLSTLGYLLFTVAALVAVLNFYLSFIRPLIRAWLGRECGHVSGIPLLGSLFLIAALVCVQHTTLTWVLATALVLIDTGGLFWLLIIIALNASDRRNGRNL